MKHLFLSGACLVAVGLVTAAQYTVAPVTYSFLDISVTGTPIGIAGTDDSGVLVPLGFDFDFYSASIDQLAATTNGYLTTGSDLADFSPDCPAPQANEPNGLIAPFFDDLSATAHGEVYAQTFGTAPNRMTVVQWDDMSTFDSSFASLTFQVRLAEADGTIQFHYESLTDTSGVFPALGDTAFIGIEDAEAGSATEVGCMSGPVLANATAFEFRPTFPAISAPTEVVSGTTFTVEGLANAGSLYLFAWSLDAGPTGPIPPLENLVIELGGFIHLAGSGITPLDGAVESEPFLAPFGFEGTVVNWQMITIGSLGPIANVRKSNPDTITLRDGITVEGSIDAVGVADSFTFPGIAGEVVSLTLCRRANLPDGSGSLDPLLCLVAPSGFIEATDDDSAGECLVVGPFGASAIREHTLLETGTYTVYASSYQGTLVNDETGPYELTVLAPAGAALTQLADEGPLCPGQALTHPFDKLEGLVPPLRRR